MQKPTPTATAAQGRKSRTTTASKAITKNKHRMYAHGKKIADRVMNIFNYQYQESDLEQFVF
jgi:hypothetical protein